MLRRHRATIACAVFFIQAPIQAQPAPAADPVAAPAPESASAYVIPDAPAFTILSVTPTTIDRPASLTKLGASLANLINEKGVVRSGFALEVSLRGLGYLNQASHYGYMNDPLTRFLARLAFSIGTVADSATAASPAQTRLAVGLRLVFFDDSDPLLDAAYLADMNAAIKACSDKDLPEKPQCETDNYARIKRVGRNIRWNYGGLSLGTAQSFAFEESRLDDGELDQFGVWGAGGFGLSTWFQLSLGAKYVRSFAADGNSGTFSGRTRIGTDSLRGSIEVAYTYNDPKTLDVPLAQAALGAEVRLSDAIWLNATLGGSINQASDVKNLFGLSNIKWNFETAPSWPQSGT